MNNDQKIAVVTGASGGIGSDIANYLLENNYQVFGWCRSSFLVNHKNFHSVLCDFSSPEKTEITVKEFIKKISSLDLIILAAGFGEFKEVEQFSLKQMQNLMNVNFLSQAVLVKHLLPLLKKTEQSKIISIVSEAALAGARKGAFYCASKFALRGFMQSLRAECASSNIAVTTINPGFVDTDFFADLNFRPGEDPANAIRVDQITKTLAMILQMENNCVIEEIVLQPLKKVLVKS